MNVFKQPTHTATKLNKQLMKKIVLFASGSGTNIENIYNHLLDNNNITIEKVYCNNPQAFVIKRCETLGLPCRVFNRDDFYKNGAILDELKQINPDLIVLAGFLWLIPTSLVSAFSDNIINIHPALLPKFGGKGMYGAHVHEAVVDQKESETGITIHHVNEHYDEGSTIFQAKCSVDPTDSAEDVAQKVHRLEYEHFPRVIIELLT